MDQVFNRINFFMWRNEEGIIYFLLFFLTFVIIFNVLKKTIFKEGEERKFAAITSFIVSAIGIWYVYLKIGLEHISFIYSFAGMTILLLVPLIVLILFLCNLGVEGYVRKLAIVAYGVISFYYLQNMYGEVSQFKLMLGILVLLFFILIEKSICNKAIVEKEK